MTEFWAICQYYEPFVMGGNAWQFRRFKVPNAEPVDFTTGHKGFVYEDKRRDKWIVHELATGGWMGDGETKEEAILVANKNFDETPDINEQIADLGGVMNHKEVSFEDAQRRLNRNG